MRSFEECMKREFCLCGLVNGKAAVIREEVRSLTTMEAFRDILDDIADRGTRGSYSAFLVRLSAAQISDYDLRIMFRVEKYPARLLVLAHAAPEISCPVRKALCQKLLEEDPASLHLTALKLRTVFLEEVKACSRDGTLSMPLFAIMRTLASAWRPDSQDKTTPSTPLPTSHHSTPHHTTNTTITSTTTINHNINNNH